MRVGFAYERFRSQRLILPNIFLVWVPIKIFHLTLFLSFLVKVIIVVDSETVVIIKIRQKIFKKRVNLVEEPLIFY